MIWTQSKLCIYGSDWATCSRMLLRMIYHMLHWLLLLAQIQKKKKKKKKGVFILTHLDRAVAVYS